MSVESSAIVFTGHYRRCQVVRFPVAHHEGNYYVDDDGLKALEDNGQIAFRYTTPDGEVTAGANPNGSRDNIAGVFNAAGNVLGMMPHPERLADAALGGDDGRAMFDSLVEALG